MLCTCIWKSFAVCGEEQGIGMVEQEPLGLSVVFPVLELSIHFIIHALMLLSGTVQKVYPHPTPQLCPVMDWYLQNWARLNLFFIFVVYPTPLYSGNKILVGSLGWPWTPPYPSVSASKRAGITDIHHRVLPLQMLLIPGFCFRARKLAWWTCLVLCSSSECSPFFPLNSALSFHSFLFLRPLYWFRFMKQGSYNNYLPFTVCTRCRKQSHSHMLSIFPALQLHRAPEIPGRRGLYHLGLSPSRSQRREEAHLMLETTEPAVPGPWLIK